MVERLGYCTPYGRTATPPMRMGWLMSRITGNFRPNVPTYPTWSMVDSESWRCTFKLNSCTYGVRKSRLTANTPNGGVGVLEPKIGTPGAKVTFLTDRLYTGSEPPGLAFTPAAP